MAGIFSGCLGARGPLDWQYSEFKAEIWIFFTKYIHVYILVSIRIFKFYFIHFYITVHYFIKYIELTAAIRYSTQEKNPLNLGISK